MHSQKGSVLVPLLMLIVLIGGLAVGLKLVSIPQIFRSRASEVTTPFYAQVQCDQNGRATFSWSELPEAAEYIVNVHRTANTPAVGVEAGRRTSATGSLVAGADYPDWEIKVGLKTGGYQTFDQKEFSCNGTVSGTIPAELVVHPMSIAVTCAANGSANFQWSDYPGAVNYQVLVYPNTGEKISLNAGRSNSVNASLQPGATYTDWELVVKLDEGVKVLDQLDFTCNGSTRGEVPAVVASTAPSSAPSAAPSTSLVVTTQSVSSPPTNLRVQCSGSNNAQFSWAAASKTGTSVTNYILQINKDPSEQSSSGDSVVQVGPSLSYSPWLATGGRYIFSVQAVFSDGTNSENVSVNEFSC